MEKEQNVAILKEAYERWHETKGGSVDHWLSIMEDNIIFNSLAQGTQGAEFTRQSTCKADMQGYFEGLLGQLEMIHYHVDEYIAKDNNVVVIGNTKWKNRKTGKFVDTPKVDVIKMKDGLMTEFSEYYDTAALVAAGQED